ncbi:MAG TPA: hypothetical protein VER08_08740 [Pyrinomonadaceae bacterium]|nr:hypothetical protein [Pyrinomonadaceae bacterium]
MRVRRRAAALLAALLLTTTFVPAQDLEQRAEALRGQLRDLAAKESELQNRLQELEEELRPENIQRSVAHIGTTRPEELRARRREQLEREQAGIRRQLEDLANSRARVEAAVSRLEAEADRARTAAPTETTPPAARTDGNAPAAPAVNTPSAAPARRPARRTRRARTRRRARTD